MALRKGQGLVGPSSLVASQTPPDTASSDQVRSKSRVSKTSMSSQPNMICPAIVSNTFATTCRSLILRKMRAIGVSVNDMWHKSISRPRAESLGSV